MRKFYLIFFIVFQIAEGYAQEENCFLYERGKSFDTVPAYAMRVPVDLRQHAAEKIWEEKQLPEAQTTLIYKLILPEYVEGVFFSRDFRAGDHSWPNNTNRLLPWYFKKIADLRADDYPGIPSNGKVCVAGDALLLHLKDGKCLFLKAVAGENSLSWFRVNTDGTVNVLVSTLGLDTLNGKVPFLLSSSDTSVYGTLDKAYKKLTADRRIADLSARKDKKWYEPFSYLGWCTWEHYYRNINEGQLEKDICRIEESGLPVRYVLIDDGHVRNKAEQLTSFKPDSLKFPSGWAPLLNMRDPDKIRWMGLWYGFPGFWQGIALENDFPEYVRKHLYVFQHSLLPGKRSEDIEAYYRYYLESLRSYGFDFLKIDVQSFVLPLYMGGRRVIYQARECNKALEKEAHRLGLGLINCMAQNVLNTDHTRYSAVTRVSIDYKKFDEDMARSHLFQSYMNTLWLGQTVWPDHDMFHSCDTVCGGMMARSKAVSGGPVYLSDAPEDFAGELIWPLVNEEGLLYRPEAPAVPAPESVFTNPVYSGKAFRVIAPVGERAMAMICYNLNKASEYRNITAVLRREDYLRRECMTGKRVSMPEQMVVYDWESRKAEILEDSLQVDLKGFCDRLLYFCPVTDGWAVIGLQEKYLSPATVNIVSCHPHRLVVDVADCGILKVWCDSGETPGLRSIAVDKPQRIVIDL
ncbi:Sip1-related alpha-galactosidase [Culturomica massiliensis]|uniref:Sip1-related alpha-galactosidase n=1 Tax=Culturomica massiliensis TaxID=1841857 RepID=UPI003B599588